MVYFCLCFFLLLPRLVVMSDTPSPTPGLVISSTPSPTPAVFPAYTPTDNILINCGAPNKDASLDGREWDTESTSILTYSPYMFNTSQATFRALQQSDSVDEIPYSTVCIFSSKFTYTIPVSKAGQKFLRLYFYPSYYVLGFDMTKPLFSVDAANHTLLSNFSPFLHLKPPSLTLIKEYVITVNQSRVLEVTFTPSPNSYAFVNGIEIVSIPDDFYIKGNDDAIKMVGQKNQFYIDDSMALEKLYRFNVGDSGISSTDDTGMFRSWETDEPYLFELDTGITESSSHIRINYTLTTPPYAAPTNVYSSVRTAVDGAPNLTWSFEVDSGFYLLRLHFCELENYLDSQRVFSIFINNQTAEQSVNVSYWSGAVQTPVYKDYAVFVSDSPDDSKSRPYLWLTLRSNYIENGTYYENAILNGLEIFKLSQPGGTLAAPNGPNPELVSLETKKNRGISHSTLVGASIGEESLKKFGEVGYSCLGDQGMDRPTMRDVVSSLEVALQLQESQGKLDQDNLYLTKSVADARSGEASTSSTSSDGFKSGIGSVFSDILNPDAR
ncbi:Protein kinase domain-containing protein [Heracleum sosnowskyi]|uniref:Protein kinase domain-containing protein n=1 Tax=Heracleum sosnowskyi TaxID=360622 RepID=A0AAD8GQS0_9APIA|nr:Protein kinase domain-containing protein [Heracleum sosnowskyi]